MSRQEVVERGPAVALRRSGYQVGEWLLGIAGGIATFVGAFILLADEDQFVGTGGSLTWRVGDIARGWGYGLLAAGVLALIVVVAIVLRGRASSPRPVETATRELSDLITHVLIFVVVNAFIWLQDIQLGEGVDYAYWITVPWAVGLLAHAYTWVRTRRSAPSPLDRS